MHSGAFLYVRHDIPIEKKSYDYVRLSFTDGTTPAQFVTSLVVTVQYGGEDLASPVYFAQTDVTTVNSVDMVSALYIDVQGLAVPEPTTATLSLIALAGLMARRRRK